MGKVSEPTEWSGMGKPSRGLLTVQIIWQFVSMLTSSTGDVLALAGLVSLGHLAQTQPTGEKKRVAPCLRYPAAVHNKFRTTPFQKNPKLAQSFTGILPNLWGLSPAQSRSKACQNICHIASCNSKVFVRVNGRENGCWVGSIGGFLKYGYPKMDGL